MSTSAVGILGCGRMGSAIARRLTEQGHQVVLWNRTAETAQTLATEIGAEVVATPRELAQRPVVLSMLTDGQAATDTYEEPENGLLADIPAETVVVEMATMTPTQVQALAAATEKAGATLLESPVSGRPIEVAAGKATLLVGGEDAPLEKARSPLEALGPIVQVGPIGTGSVMKLAVNAVVFAYIGGLGEALAMAHQAGIPGDKAYDALEASAVGSEFVRVRRSSFLDADSPVQFPMAGAAGVLGAIVVAGEKLGVTMPVSSSLRSVMSDAKDDGKGGLDITRLAQVLSG